MTRSARLLLVLLASTLPAGAASATDPPPGVEGLVEVKAKHVDDAWLLPGADFREYTKVMIDAAEVSFRKNWLRDQNARRSLSRRIDEKDAQEIAAAARADFNEIFAKGFADAGYTIATAPGPDVLRLSPEVVDLYINAPDIDEPGRVDTYTVEAGEARLILEARDSVTGALLGVAIDRRRAGNYGGPAGFGQLQWRTSVSNNRDFEQLYRAWARISVNGLRDLKEQSPVTEANMRRK